MKRRIPVLFFVLACFLNWAGLIWNIPKLPGMVKPALMPLLALCVLAYAITRRLDRRKLSLLVSAQLFGCAGDICLLRSSFPLFAGGIGAFLVGHLFYISIYGKESWKGMGWKFWTGGIVAMLALVAGLVKLLHISGALLAPMAIYGLVLSLLMFSTFCGLVRLRDKGTWFILFAGSVIFTFSDSLIAAQTFEVLSFPLMSFVIMFTYLVAQSLLAWGTVRLAKE